jgi:hypothetical protein
MLKLSKGKLAITEKTKSQALFLGFYPHPLWGGATP